MSTLKIRVNACRERMAAGEGLPAATTGKPRGLIKRLHDESLGTEYERRRRTLELTGIERVTINGKAGKLTGTYHASSASPAARKVVLFIHGSASPAEHQIRDFSQTYNAAGVDVLALNMRGFGESEGQPSEAGMYDDANSMLEYLVETRGVAPQDILIHGYSMGAPIAARLASHAAKVQLHVSGLLLDRPMPSVKAAVNACQVPNPANLTGLITSWAVGSFDVRHNLSRDTQQLPIMLLTDSEDLGVQGEILRQSLRKAGFSHLSGARTAYAHEDSLPLMQAQIGNIKAHLLDRQPAIYEI